MTALALRYLFARKKQTFLMLLGIFFGTAAYVTISGFMLGFREYMVDQLVNNNAHVRIRAREEFLEAHSLDTAFFGNRAMHVFWDPPPSGSKDSSIVENPQSWYRRLDADPRVVAYSPQLTAAVIFSTGKITVPATLVGCDPEQQTRVTTVGDYVTDGAFADLSAGGNRVVIGEELRKRLGARVDQNLFISFGRDRPEPFKVAGIFSTGNKLNDEMAYSALADVQRVSRAFNHVNEIAVKLDDHTKAAQKAGSWAGLASETVESWDQVNESLFNIFRIQDAVRFLSIGAILIVAGFGIYNVLNMTVVQKRRDIAILQSMGYAPSEIVRLFFLQGLLLGLSGTAFGLIAGYAICRYLETLPFTGGPLGAGPGTLQLSFSPRIYFQAGMLALLAAILASVLPARSAGKLTPIEIIRAGAE